MSYITDHLEMLTGIAECIAEQFGSNCEVVLHDLTRPYDNTIVAIWNGHVTGRKVGGSGTNTGLEILRGTAEPKDTYHYINTTPDGKILRSSSKYFKDESGRVVGSLCINYDITDLTALQKTLQEITEPDKKNTQKEMFTSNVDELLDAMLLDAVHHTGKEVKELEKEDKVAIVHYLDGKGAFLIKKSAERVADFLGISRFTVYNYLNEEQWGEQGTT